MKIKLDENLPRRLAAALQELGHDIDTVHSEGLAGARDEVVRAAAQTHHRLLVTQDVGLADLRTPNPRRPFGVLLIRLGEPRRNRLLDRVREVFRRHDVEEWTNSVVVVTQRKIRVRNLSVS